MQQLTQKLNNIFEIIRDIKENDDPAVGEILLDGFGISLNVIEQVAKNDGRETKIDISEYIEMVSNVLGVSLEDMVMSVIQDQSAGSDKEADQDTLNFITSNVDDYEKFLAQNKAKESIDFLAKTI